MKILARLLTAVSAAAILLPATVFADTIDPTTFSASLEVGESVTIRKTVVVEETTASAVLDVMFVFDVSGSMGAEIESAKESASAILAGLSGFGDLATGSGWYSDIEPSTFPSPGFDGVHIDLNTTNTAAASGIDDMWDSGSCTVAGAFVGCGGDFPELGYAAIAEAAEDTSWRPGSKKVIIAFGDASFKGAPGEAATKAALDAEGIDLIGVSFSSFFANDILGLGGEVFEGGSSGALIAEAIKDGIDSSFAKYETVTVGDLGGGMPGVGVSVECVSAAAGGSCVGASAIGDWTREMNRTFEYDVTFTALAEGGYDFPTHALVDGGIVASEADSFKIGPGAGDPGPGPGPDDPPTAVAEPGTLALLGFGLLGLALIRRRA